MFFENDYAFLSNSYECPVSAPIYGDTYTFSCLEAAYWASRCKNIEDAVKFVGIDGAAAEEMRALAEPRDDWRHTKLYVMELLVFYKFRQNPELRSKLCKIKGPIVFENTWADTYWGVFQGAGENYLGIILTKVRDTLCLAVERVVSTGVDVLSDCIRSAGETQHYTDTQISQQMRSLLLFQMLNTPMAYRAKDIAYKVLTRGEIIQLKKYPGLFKSSDFLNALNPDIFVFNVYVDGSPEIVHMCLGAMYTSLQFYAHCKDLSTTLLLRSQPMEFEVNPDKSGLGLVATICVGVPTCDSVRWNVGDLDCYNLDERAY